MQIYDFLHPNFPPTSTLLLDTVDVFLLFVLLLSSKV